nr:acetyl-CoA carboxylase biotin carboxylase subunit [Dehalococcoidia bacterium]
MFTKIFIANRGEIACRIIRTASRMGIKTVVVYSEADTNARHVRLADEAFLIGPSAPNESYLSQNAMIDALRESQADAVHPGYGFLSENSDFARSVADTGAVFIGPDPNAIAAMGDKIQSKKIAQEAGLHVIPGYLGEVKDAKHAIEIANDISYPVMIKGSSGGGGKGMRVAHNDDELKRSFELAQNEARTSFGDDRLLVERYIERPRHIEIQVLGDTHSNIVHLNERECSVQRRHQKVIEEAPSPFVDPDLRSRMGWQAVTFAKKVGYYSAGTVEFIVGSDKQFYFLEMNTRLQVEHPVTEMITGLDLVEQMIRVAAGERLQFSQEDIGIDGWAVETRIYAEDPERGFLPATGRLTRYLPPRETSTIRLDSGVEEGEEVSVFYDPMMAKLITHGSDRATAIASMQTALHSFVIRGVAHNVNFLCAVLGHAKFKLGELTTDFIAEQYPDGFDATTFSKKTEDILVAVGAFVHIAEMQR